MKRGEQKKIVYPEILIHNELSFVILNYFLDFSMDLDAAIEEANLISDVEGNGELSLNKQNEEFSEFSPAQATAIFNLLYDNAENSCNNCSQEVDGIEKLAVISRCSHLYVKYFFPL